MSRVVDRVIHPFVSDSLISKTLEELEKDKKVIPIMVIEQDSEDSARYELGIYYFPVKQGKYSLNPYYMGFNFFESISVEIDKNGKLVDYEVSQVKENVVQDIDVIYTRETSLKNEDKYENLSFTIFYVREVLE